MSNIKSDKLQCRTRSTKYQILPKIIKIYMLMTSTKQSSLKEESSSDSKLPVLLWLSSNWNSFTSSGSLLVVISAIWNARDDFIY